MIIHRAHKVTVVWAKRQMPKTCNKLGYVCPICGLDYGWDETVIQKSTRKRGVKNKLHVLSKRRIDEEKIHLTKASLKSVESGLYNFVADLFEKLWLDVANDGIEKLRRNGTWNRFPVQDQEYVLNEIAKMKARIELRKKEEWEDEQKYQEWKIDLTKQDAPFYELSKKVVTLYQSQINEIDNNGVRVNPLLEIKKYRRHGDVLRHLYIDERDRVRVLWKYPSLIQRIEENGKKATIQKGLEFLRKYREPFSDARWRYTWIEWFWISLCAYMISSRRAARMAGILDVSMNISPKYIKN